VGITHYGVREIGEALSNPDIPTTYFPPTNLIYVGEMRNSQIQQSSPGATQTFILNKENTEQIKRILETIEKSTEELKLDSQKNADLLAEIKTLQAQFTSSNPNPTIIKEGLKSVKRILEGVAGSAIATGLVSQIAALL
jgi:hypothetical protein